MATYLMIFLIVAIALMFYFVIQWDTEQERFRHNLRPGRKVQFRNGRNFEVVILKHWLTPDTVYFVYLASPHRTGVSHISKFYPL